MGWNRISTGTPEQPRVPACLARGGGGRGQQALTSSCGGSFWLRRWAAQGIKKIFKAIGVGRAGCSRNGARVSSVCHQRRHPGHIGQTCSEPLLPQALHSSCHPCSGIADRGPTTAAAKLELCNCTGAVVQGGHGHPLNRRKGRIHPSIVRHIPCGEQQHAVKRRPY